MVIGYLYALVYRHPSPLSPCHSIISFILSFEMRAIIFHSILSNVGTASYPESSFFRKAELLGILFECLLELRTRAARCAALLGAPRNVQVHFSHRRSIHTSW
jgi:hypothetical protein